GRPLLEPVPPSPAASAADPPAVAAKATNTATLECRAICELRFELIPSHCAGKGNGEQQGAGAARERSRQSLDRSEALVFASPSVTEGNPRQKELATPRPSRTRCQCRAGGLRRPERRADPSSPAGSRAGEDRTMANRKKPLVVVTRKLPDRV